MIRGMDMGRWWTPWGDLDPSGRGGKPPMTFDDLRRANTERDSEWGSVPKGDTMFYGVALAGEVGEALNILKKLTLKERGVTGTMVREPTAADLREEIADIAISLDLFARACGVDLEDAVREKFNARGERKGLKARL